MVTEKLLLAPNVDKLIIIIIILIQSLIGIFISVYDFGNIHIFLNTKLIALFI